MLAFDGFEILPKYGTTKVFLESHREKCVCIWNFNAEFAAKYLIRCMCMCVLCTFYYNTLVYDMKFERKRGMSVEIVR